MSEYKFKENEYLFTKYMIEYVIRLLEEGLYEYPLNDLVELGLNPFKTDKVLRDLGYEQINFDTNGWQGDTWVCYEKEEHPPITMYYEGWDFDLKLMLTELD